MKKHAGLAALEGTEQMTFAAVKAAVERQRPRARGKKFIGLFKHGGIGDVLQLGAFARAVKRRIPRSYIVVLCRDLGPDADGRPLTNNILRGNAAVDHTICYPAQDWHRSCAEFYAMFDVFFEVQYVVQSYYWKSPQDQHRADLLLRPYRLFADQFPRSNRDLDRTGKTQWELLAASSGMDVTADDLTIEIGSRRFAPEERFVTVHNMAGGMAMAKCASLLAMNELCQTFREAKYIPVQVGAKTDPLMTAAQIDARGLTINGTAAVLQRATLHIDIEGGLVCVAKAVGTRSAVLFGPTPPSVFAFPGNIVISTQACQPCWWHSDRWSVNCRNQWPICRNIPGDGRMVGEALVKLLAAEEVEREQAKPDAHGTQENSENV